MAAEIVGKTLEAARLSRALLPSDVERETGISQPVLLSYEKQTGVVDSTATQLLSDLYSYPKEIFSVEFTDFEPPLVDFRTPGNQPAKLGAHGIKKLAQARQFHQFAESVALEIGLESKLKDNASRHTSPASLAQSMRDFIQLKDGARSEFESSEDWIKHLRAKIEKRNIIVFREKIRDNFRGAFFGSQILPFIVLNSHEQSIETQAFTLLHELAHAFIGKAGISDPLLTSNATERLCNKAAAEIIFPREEFREAFKDFYDRDSADTVEIVKSLSSKFFSSKQAAAIRVSELVPGQKDFYQKWENEVGPFVQGNFFNSYVIDNTDFDDEYDKDSEEADSTTDIRRAKWPTKLVNRFGTLIPILMEQAVQKGVVARTDIDRFLGLKVGYQDDTFARAHARRAEARVDL